LQLTSDFFLARPGWAGDLKGVKERRRMNPGSGISGGATAWRQSCKQKLVFKYPFGEKTQGPMSR